MAAVVVAVLSWIGWQQHEKTTESEYTATVTAKVKEAMQTYLDTDTDLQRYRVQVINVSLVRESEHKYTGLATLQTPRTSWEEITIEVTASDDKVFWRTQPGAFYFLAREGLAPTSHGQ